MYHIFVLIALAASQNQIDKIKQPVKNSPAKTVESANPSYPPQPENNDILEQFKKEIAKEDAAVKKVTQDELDSFALDSTDAQSKIDDDFLNTPVANASDDDFASQTSQPKPLTPAKSAENQTSNQKDLAKIDKKDLPIPALPSDNKPPEAEKVEIAKAEEKILSPGKLSEDQKNATIPQLPKLLETKTESESKSNPEIPIKQIASNSKDKISAPEMPKIPEKPKTEIAVNDQKDNKSKASDSDQNTDKTKSENVVSKTLKNIKEALNINKDSKKTKEVKVAAADSKMPKSDLKTKDADKNADKDQKEEKPVKKSKKQLRLERIKAQQELAEKRKLQKLEELRQKYLAEFDPITAQPDLELDEYQRISNIIPQKKSEPKIIQNEVPSQLLVRIRSKDNKYHPILPDYKERINFMFKAIAQGRIDDFNALFYTINQPNLKNSYGDTLLTFSILMQKPAAISSLLNKGADPNLSNYLLYKPMNLAIEMIDYKSVFLLSQMGADVNYIDELGRTYLMQAARVGSLPIVDFLIAKGVDVNHQDNNGMTALGLAYKYRKEIIVKYLLKNGAKSWIPKEIKESKKSLILELENRWK